MPVAWPYSLNASALRISTPIRASREAFDLVSTGGSSTPISFSRSAGVPSPRSAYIGWKQPAVRPARAATANSRTAILLLADHIDDPLGHHDHLPDGLAVQGQFYRIEGQNGTLNFGVLGFARHCDFTALLTVDLDDQGHGVFDQQIAFNLRPIGFRDQPLLAQHHPAFLSQVRHHRR